MQHIDTVYDLWLAEQQATYFGFEPGGDNEANITCA